MSSLLPPPPVQEAIINTNLNNMLLSTLFMGVYTVVCFGTLYIYASKKTSKKLLIIGIISLSYSTYVVTTCAAWYLVKIAFINNGMSQEAVFTAIYTPPQWAYLLTNIRIFLNAALADGLLIWRCFNVWDCSFLAISLPLFLLICDIGIDLSEIILNASAPNLTPSANQARILNILIGASNFTAFATTLVTAVLIGYRIHTVSKQDILQRSRSRFNHIIEILVQSAAAYSIATIARAITVVIPTTNNNFVILNAAHGYIDNFYSFIAGVAPTIMVARVALSADEDRDTSAMTHISGLNFRFTVSNATQLEIKSIHPKNGDSHFLQEPNDPDVKQERSVHIA